MEVEKQVAFWQSGAREELNTAALLLKNDKVNQGLFWAHLAMETESPRGKALKALVTQHTRAIPPFIHDLVRLADEAAIPLDDEQRAFLAPLRFFLKWAIRNLKIIEPVGYLDMVMLEQSACMILTDSGGIQKEAYWLGVPCVTLRDETEWVETVQTGWNVVVGAKRERIVECVRTFRPTTTTSTAVWGWTSGGSMCAPAGKRDH